MHNASSENRPSNSQQIYGGAHPFNSVNFWSEPAENNQNTRTDTLWEGPQGYNDSQRLFGTQFPPSVEFGETENIPLLNSAVMQEGSFGLDDTTEQSPMENFHFPLSGIESMEWMPNDAISNPFDEFLDTDNPREEMELIGSQIASIEVPSTTDSAVPLTEEVSNLGFQQQSSLTVEQTHRGYILWDQESEAVAKNDSRNTMEQPRVNEEDTGVSRTNRKFVLAQTYRDVALKITDRVTFWALPVQYIYHRLAKEEERDHYLLTRDRGDKNLEKRVLASDVVA
jgi:hypothetical protein